MQTEKDIDFVNDFGKLDFGEFASDFMYLWYILTRNVHLLEQDAMMSLTDKMYCFTKEFNVDKVLIENITQNLKI